MTLYRLPLMTDLLVLLLWLKTKKRYHWYNDSMTVYYKGRAAPKCLAPRLISLFLKLPYWGTGGNATFPLIKQGNFRSCCAAKLQLYIMRLSVCLHGSRPNFRALLIFFCFCCVCGWICWSARWPQLRGTRASGASKRKAARERDDRGLQ